jgi:glycerate kinase
MLKALDAVETKGIDFTIATDVSNPLYGEQGAAVVFAPQKGATPSMVRELDERARQFARTNARKMGFDRSQAAGAGAAGGLGYAFMQWMDADNVPGIDLWLQLSDFARKAEDADLVITGEGSADRQTLMGKLPMGVLEHAEDAPVALIAGRISDRDTLLHAGFAWVECINPPDMSLEEVMRKEVAQHNISLTARRIFCNVKGAHLEAKRYTSDIPKGISLGVQKGIMRYDFRQLAFKTVN